MRPVLYYVHHHGLGHWRRALAVTRHLTRPVVLASSADPPHELPPHARHLHLPLDAPAADAAGPHDAHGRLHWAPAGHTGLLARHHLLLADAVAQRPAVAVVDVSMELIVLLRVSGIPVVAVRLPGDRSDPAHRLGLDLADEVVMPVPESWGLHRGLARTTAVGLVGADASQTPAVAPPGAATFPGSTPPTAAAGAAPPRVVVVVGGGGSRLDATECARIARELPGHEVRVLGLDGPDGPDGLGNPGDRPPNLSFAGRVADPRDELAAASVVIGNAGLGTVSDVVAAGRPFVVVPEERPFGEQQATGRALAASGAGVTLAAGPPPIGGWRTAVLTAASGPLPARAGADVEGARRFARLIEQRAAEHERAVAHQSPIGERAAIAR